METNIVTADNGTKVLFADLPGIPSGTVQAWFRAGSALEDSKNHGIAHFLEHMFFKGTKKRPGSKMAKDVESYGGEVNAFTSFDYTCYYINSPQTHILKSTEILLDMVSNPSFLNSELIPERGVVLEEYRRSQDNSNQYAFQLLQEKIFSKGYAHPILGKEKDITKFTRQQIVNFRKKFYTRENFMLIVAGDLKNNQQKLMKTIEQFPIPKGKENQFSSLHLNKKSHSLIHKKDVTMAHFSMVTEGLPISSQLSPSEDLAICCLGQGESSRLYKGLVLNKNIANRVSSSTLFMNKGSAHFLKVIYPHENQGKVLEQLYKVIEDLYHNGFSSKELDRIKNQYIASKVYEREHIESMAFSLGYGFAQYNDLDGDKKFINQINKVTVEQANSAFRNIVKRTIHVNQQVSLKEDDKKYKVAMDQFLAKVKKLGQSKSKLEEKMSKGPKVLKSSYDPVISCFGLKNDSKLLYRHNDMTPTFVLQCYIKGGLSEETERTNGSFNLISSLLTSGHKNLSRENLKMLLEEKSASLHGFSGKNAYGLMMHGQSKDFEVLSDLFFNSLSIPSFNPDDLKHEKEIVKRSLQSFYDEPTRILFRNVSEEFFPGHPYSYISLGTDKSQKNLTRSHLLDLHQQQIAKGNMVFTFCGDINQEVILKKMTQNNFNITDTVKVSNKIKKSTIHYKFSPKKIHHSIDREQTHLFYGLPTKDISHKHHLSLKILTAYLSGQSSELFTDVRDKKGLCYVAQPIHFNALEGGYWGIYMASTPTKVTKAIESLDKIIHKMTTKGLSKSEFNRIKVMMKGQNLINVQTNEDYAGIYSVPLLQGMGLDYYHIGNDKIDQLTIEEFSRDIQAFFKKGLALFTVGPN